MKVTFVFGTYENLGVEYLSGYLKAKGHDTELVFSPMLFNDAYVGNSFLGKIFAHIKYLAKKVVKTEPDLVAFSAYRLSDCPSWPAAVHPSPESRHRASDRQWSW